MGKTLICELKKCFRDWVTSFHIHYPCGKSQLYYIESNYDEAKQEILKFGLNRPYYRPDYGFFEGIWNQSRCIKELYAIFDEHINGIIKQYDDFSNQLLIE